MPRLGEWFRMFFLAFRWENIRPTVTRRSQIRCTPSWENICEGGGVLQRAKGFVTHFIKAAGHEEHTKQLEVGGGVRRRTSRRCPRRIRRYFGARRKDGAFFFLVPVGRSYRRKRRRRLTSPTLQRQTVEVGGGFFPLVISDTKHSVFFRAFFC